MSVEAARTAGHPRLATLALYSRGDLGWTTRLRVGHHLRSCDACDSKVLQFRSAESELKREAATQTLTGFEAITDWARLEREMLGNIGVGVAAARCIENVGRKRLLTSRGVWVTIALAVLFAAGWFMNIPSEQREHLTASVRRTMGIEATPLPGSVVKTTREGIAVRAQGATFTILHPPSALVSLAGSSSLGARYVDEQTGQVTITNVYGE